MTCSRTSAAPSPPPSREARRRALNSWRSAWSGFWLRCAAAAHARAPWASVSRRRRRFHCSSSPPARRWRRHASRPTAPACSTSRPSPATGSWSCATCSPVRCDRWFAAPATPTGLPAAISRLTLACCVISQGWSAISIRIPPRAWWPSTRMAAGCRCYSGAGLRSIRARTVGSFRTGSCIGSPMTRSTFSSSWRTAKVSSLRFTGLT